VGSGSFRPSSYSQRGGGGGTVDDLLGVLPSRRKSREQQQQQGTTTTTIPRGSPVSPVLVIPESLPQPPVCTKIPPTDLRANYDDDDDDDDDMDDDDLDGRIVDSSSLFPPRNNSASDGGGGVQWEKVTTATPGEEDYVPLVDYTHMKPNQEGGGMTPTGSASTTTTATAQGSRLERHRKLVDARRKQRRLGTLIMVLPLGFLVVAVAIYFQYFYHYDSVQQKQEVSVNNNNNNNNNNRVDKVEIVTIYKKSYDTSLLQDRDPDDNFCFDAAMDESGNDNHSLMVTFPKFIPPVVQILPELTTKGEKKKRRRGPFGGLLGLFRKN
jgi:hypothetical protein